MGRNREIKVYLPDSLIRQLASKKEKGLRSKFIQDAIEKRLKNENNFDIWHCQNDEVFDECVTRFRRLEGQDFETELVHFLRRIYR